MARLSPRSSNRRLEAFSDLVARHQDRAYGYAYAVLRDSAAAEDVTQASPRGCDSATCASRPPSAPGSGASFVRDFLKQRRARAEADNIFAACLFGDLEAVKRFLATDPGVVNRRRSTAPGLDPTSSQRCAYDPFHSRIP